MVSAILVSMFSQLTRDEVNAMLGTPLEETRVYRDAKAEGQAEGEAKGKAEGQAEGKAEMLLTLITFRFGTMPDAFAQQITGLPIDRLETLGTALFTLSDRAALEAWLTDNTNQH